MMAIRARRLAPAMLAVALALAGCTSSPPPPRPGGSGCVPLFTATPLEVAPGGTVTLTASDDCTPPTPSDGWTIMAAPVGRVDRAVRVHTTDDVDGDFQVDVTLPADFPIGEAFITLENWDDSACDDTGASCAAASADFTVVDATP